jgi:hypothetical protein
VKLKIAENLSLPVEIVTQTVAVLAKRRAGKSYLMRRLVEQLAHAQQQVVLVDQKGDQWGVRSAADGKAAGLPLVILGGERGDVPLEAGSGEVVAKLVVEERVSVVLDLSLFRKHEVATFMTGFMENLYRLKAKEIYRTPMMLVIDEADAVAPQKPQKGEERMLGAAEDIVRRGGQRGIGCVFLTQRSAVLNKNVLTQAQVMIALRTIAPQDLAAMNAWIDVHGTEEQKRTLMESLPSLPVGDAWVWSPGWPTVDGIFKRVHVLPIETYDSGASPDPGQKKRAEPKSVAEVDLDALKRQMSATIEKAKADDPKELRKVNAELRAQLAAKDKVLVQVDTQTKRIEERLEKVAGSQSGGKFAEIRQELARHRRALEDAMKILVKVKAFDFPIETEDDRKALEVAVAGAVRQITAPIEKRVTALAARVEGIRAAAGAAEKAITALLDEKIDLTVQVSKREPFAVAADRPRPERPSKRSPGVVVDGLTPAEQRILNAVAWWRSAQIDAPTRHQVAFVAGYTVNGHFNNLVGGLRSKGQLDYPTGGGVMLTDAGIAASQSDGDVPTREALIDKVLDVLEPSPGKIFKAVAVAGRDLNREELAQATGYTVNGHFNNMVGSLRSLGVIDYPRQGGVRLAEMFEALS